MAPALRVEAGRSRGQDQPELHEALSLKRRKCSLPDSYCHSSETPPPEWSAGIEVAGSQPGIGLLQAEQSAEGW